MSNQINEGAARYSAEKHDQSRPELSGTQGTQSPQQLVTDHLDLWTSTVTPKSTSGRGRGSGKSSKIELTGIKKLRELILELAVRGKLMPQNPDDEPASKLLERIKAEKAQLIKDGKLKKQKPLAAVSEDDKPFELPEGWECERLGSLVSKLGSGSTPRGGKTAYVESGIPFLRSQNIWNDGLALDDIAFIPKSTHESMSNTVVFPGDILLNITGASLGRSLVFPDTFDEANVSQHVTIIRLINDRMTPFMSLCIKSPLVQSLVWGRQVGMAIEGLSKKVLECFEMPIPPLAEQQRIVAKVDELMALCDQLEQQSEHQLTAHQQLTDTLLATLTDSANALELNDNWQRLANHFDLLFSGPMGVWAIDRLKDTILQLAVMGKLVPQNPNDEPASKLLEHIEEEKARLVKEGLKTKASSQLSCDEEYIVAPPHWSWIRLGNLAKFIDYRGRTPNKIESGIRLITAKNIRKGYIDLNPEEFISESDYDSWMTRGFPRNGDMLFTTEAPMGNAANINLTEKFALAQRAICFQWHVSEVSRFMLLQTLAKPFQNQLLDQATGMTATGIKASKLKEIPVVLPPLAEQHCIVEKVDELFALCDQLKDRLQQASETEQHLTNAIVEQALN